MTHSDSSVRERLWPIAVAIGFTALVFFPIVLNRKDSFPLSTYPMFAVPRGNPELVKLVAVTSTGERVSVPPHLLGTNEVLQAKVQLNQAAQKGAKARRRYCETVAARVSRDSSLKWQELELSRSRFEPIGYFENGKKPLTVDVLARCKVGEGTPSRLKVRPMIDRLQNWFFSPVKATRLAVARILILGFCSAYVICGAPCCSNWQRCVV